MICSQVSEHLFTLLRRRYRRRSLIDMSNIQTKSTVRILLLIPTVVLTLFPSVYSLGIGEYESERAGTILIDRFAVFFELWQPFKTGMERIHVCYSC